MLETLHISNYALIDKLDIGFGPGFNVITGETGAGKSIILGALSLLLGGRADTRVIADPSSKSIIEASFKVEPYPALEQFCSEHDIEWSEDNVCTFRREISPSGRSRAFVNDALMPLSVLKELGMLLVDIHSQHQNQLLSKPEFQIKILDTLAGNADLLKEYAVRFNDLRHAVKRLKIMRLKVEKDKADEEYSRYQLEQLEALDLARGEQQELEESRDVLDNLSQTKGAIASALTLLSTDDTGALSQLRRAADAFESLKDGVPDNLREVAERLRNVEIEVADIISDIESTDDELGEDAELLPQIEERLSEIYSLCTKHHVDSGDALIDIRTALEAKVNSIDNADDTLKDLEKEARKAKALALETAREISRTRVEAAERFGVMLRETASPLGMKNLKCEMRVLPADMTVSGIDKVELLVAFNKNQELMPVGATASGGEISRLMLSVKSIIAAGMQLPAIIFDEVDTGVSGEIAARMGAMMEQIAENIQIITITHLPQVAAKGQSHFRVYKEDDESATHTRIVQLFGDERVEAIATMLGADPVDDAARMAAKSLLKLT